MFNQLTKEKAIELDELFTSMLAFKGTERIMGNVPVNEVAKTIDSLKSKDEAYISDLLYIVREIQKDLPTLFHGTTMLQLQRTSIENFLRVGGFYTIYERQRLEKRKERINLSLLWVAALTGVVGLFIMLMQYIDDRKPFYTPPQLQETPRTLSDTTKVSPLYEEKSNTKIDDSKNNTIN